MVLLKNSVSKFMMMLSVFLAVSLLLTVVVGEIKFRSGKKVAVHGTKAPSSDTTDKTTDKPAFEDTVFSVLTYNMVKETQGSENSVSKDNFESHIKYLKENGYKSIDTSQIADYLSGKKTIPDKAVLISFDSGYSDKYNIVFPILKKYGFNAVIFLDGSKVNNVNGYLTSGQITEMQKQGIEIGMHFISPNNIETASFEQQRKYLEEGKQKLETITKKPINYISYVDKKYNEDTIKAVKALGFKAGFTTAEGKANKNSNSYEVKRLNLVHNEDIQGLINKLNIK